MGLLGTQLLAPQAGQTQLTEPVKVDLHWQKISRGAKKLGIYAAINGGLPQIFEFDTGGSGFNATIACDFSRYSNWWGSSTSDPCPSPSPPASTTPPPQPSPCPTISLSPEFCTLYDSGLQYNGSQVVGSVQLFDQPYSTSAKLNAANVVIGQSTSIYDTKKGSYDWYANTSSPLSEPVEGAFYGDFGMSIKQSPIGINSLVNQLTYANGVTPGFRVHAIHGERPWVQFGLGPEDLKKWPKHFTLNTSTGLANPNPNTNTGGINNGSLKVEGSQTFSGENLTSLIFDSGATTTIHSGSAAPIVTLTNEPFPPGPFPLALTQSCSSKNKTYVTDSAHVKVSGLSVYGVEEEILSFQAGCNSRTSPEFNQVELQIGSTSNPSPSCTTFEAPCYYLNTGILPFLSYDIIFNLDPTMSFLGSVVSEPNSAKVLMLQVPAPVPLLGVMTAFSFARRLRRRMNQR